MQIIVNTPLSSEDRDILAFLIGALDAPAPVAEEDKPAPAKKAAAPKPAPEKKAEPEPEPEAEDEAEAEDEVTMEDATKAATKLVSSGDAAKVKAALTKVGAKRVSEIDGPANLAKFVALLQA
jgi:hypothetical protein